MNTKPKPPPEVGQNLEVVSNLPPMQATSPAGTTDLAPYKVHCVMQGKGGVGKTFIATLIAEHAQEQGRPLICYDADPVNPSFSDYHAFNAERLALYDGKSDELDQRGFDHMVETIIAKQADVVIDSGSTTFVPLLGFLETTGIPELLTNAGREFFIHTVVTGGPAMAYTMDGLHGLCKRLPEEAKIVVWINEHFGRIEALGKSFEQTKLYSECKSRIRGIVYMPPPRGRFFREDFQSMCERHMCFREALACTDFYLMTRQRLVMMRRDIFASMSAVPW